MERARNGVSTKRNKPARGKIDNLVIEGDKTYKKNYLNIKGVTEKDFTEFDPNTNTGKLFIRSFDKSEVAGSKLLLKMGLASIYKSQRKIYKKFIFSDLQHYLLNRNTRDWPFVTSSLQIDQFISIPRFFDKYHLASIKCQLSYFIKDEATLLFRFKYGSVQMIVNLITRDLTWIKDYKINDPLARLYPEHFERKIAKIIEGDSENR